MKKLLLLAALALVAAPACAGIVNGDWGTYDETGWDRIPSDWGGGYSWNIGFDGPTFPEGTLQITNGSGSYGWVQVIEDMPLGPVSIEADWKGSNVHWAEVMFWTVPVGTTDAAVKATFDSGPASAIAFKRDNYGMYTRNWDWQQASLSPHPSGNMGTINNEGWVVVGLKLGRANSGNAQLWIDNITVVPEPGSLMVLAGGLAGLGARLRRKS